MSNSILQKLEQIGIVLPDPTNLNFIPPKVLGDYVPYKIIDKILYISGQISIKNGEVISGKLGSEIYLKEGVKAAEVCAENILLQCLYALGSLDQVEEVIKLGGYVNAERNFMDIPQVINGASKIMVVAFGDNGKHVRFAVGCHSLPLNAAVEIEAIIKIK